MPFQSVMASWIMGVRVRGMVVVVGLGVVRCNVGMVRRRVFGEYERFNVGQFSGLEK